MSARESRLSGCFEAGWCPICGNPYEGWLMAVQFLMTDTTRCKVGSSERPAAKSASTYRAIWKRRWRRDRGGGQNLSDPPFNPEKFAVPLLIPRPLPEHSHFWKMNHDRNYFFVAKWAVLNLRKSSRPKLGNRKQPKGAARENERCQNHHVCAQPRPLGGGVLKPDMQVAIFSERVSMKLSLRRTGSSHLSPYSVLEHSYKRDM